MPRLLPRNKQWALAGAMVGGIPGVCLAGLVALLLFLVTRRGKWVSHMAV